MNEMWSSILIAAVAAFLNWFFNRLTIIAEIKKAQKNTINENRVALYTECYEILERNIADSNAVFDSNYIASLFAIKAKIKLVASNNVIHAFKNYFTWAIDIYNSYIDYCKEKDPTDQFHTETTSDGIEYEAPDFSEHDISYYEMLVDKYIIDRKIESRVVASKIQDILNAMRNDLGNDKYVEDFHIK